jgi:hypothetical protein
MTVSPNAAHLIARLQAMLGHLSRKDRATVAESIIAIRELAVRLHEATHADDPAFTIRTLEEEESHGADSHG